MNAKTNVRAGMVTALLLAVALLSGCGIGDCTAGSYRCANNKLQGCSNSEMFGPTSWQDRQVCEPPQVCRFEIAALGVETMGCYDQNAYCGPGLELCTSAGTESWLWSCVLRASDQTYRWSSIKCSAQNPPTTCIPYFREYWKFGCYEVVRNCKIGETRCEGSVAFVCDPYPVEIDNKAVFNWVTQDCAQIGKVCRWMTYYPGGPSGFDCAQP